MMFLHISEKTVRPKILGSCPEILEPCPEIPKSSRGQTLACPEIVGRCPKMMEPCPEILGQTLQPGQGIFLFGHRTSLCCEFSGPRVTLQSNVWFTFPGFQNSLPRLVSHKPYGSIFSTTCPATQGTPRGVNDGLRGNDDAVSGGHQTGQRGNFWHHSRHFPGRSKTSHPPFPLQN